MKGVLYRHLDADGCLLYVGSTDERQDRKRHLGHARAGRWWPFVDRIEREALPNRRAAYLAETVVILAERPIFNRTSGGPDQEQRESAYLTATDQGDTGSREVFDLGEYLAREQLPALPT